MSFSKSYLFLSIFIIYFYLITFFKSYIFLSILFLSILSILFYLISFFISFLFILFLSILSILFYLISFSLSYLFLLMFLSLIPKHKNAFIWVPWHFWHMRHKTKVSCIFKIQILSFMTPSLFAHILGDSIYLSKYEQKR